MKKVWSAFIVFIAVASVSVSRVARAATLYVGPGELHTTIQAGLDAASAGDSVIVRDGTYTGAGNKGLTFGGKDIVLMSEHGYQACIVDCQGSGRGFRFENGETPAAIVDGFTIRNGFVSDHGGGVLCRSSSPTIRNCVIENNVAGGSSSGGGVFWQYCPSPSLEGCTIQGNSAAIDGGGLFCDHSPAPALRNCVLASNTAGYDGGGAIFAASSHANVKNCLFVRNETGRHGGAVICASSSSPVFVNCTLTDNRALGAFSVSLGGAMHCASEASPVVLNCILWDNLAPAGSEIALVSFWGLTSSMSVHNSDVKGGNAAAYVEAGSVLTWDTLTNIQSDPLFVTGALGRAYLSQIDAGQGEDSPGLDSGSDTAANLGLDLFTTRTDDVADAGIVDMGYHHATVNRAPVADAGGPYVAQATSWDGAEVQLNSAGSYDPDGDTLVAYEWDLNLLVDSDGDGNPANDVDVTGQTPIVLFPIDQTQISLVVTDEHGAQSDPDPATVTVSVIDIGIDIKPGSHPNSINMGSHGVVPVAFLTDAVIDAASIDPTTVTLRGEDFTDGLVKLRGKKNPEAMAGLEDVDGDGDLDLVVHLETEKLAEFELDAICELGALTYDGFVVSGADTIRVVPPGE